MRLMTFGSGSANHVWRSDAKVRLEEFPGACCYFASEWKSYEGEIIVVLSRTR